MTVSLARNGPNILVNQKNLNSILSRWGLGQECFSLLSYNVMIGKAQETSHHSVREEKMKIRLSKEEDRSIYSSLNDNTYGSMNGTRMASPHVAGVAALVKEYLLKHYPNLTPAQNSELLIQFLVEYIKYKYIKLY